MKNTTFKNNRWNPKELPFLENLGFFRGGGVEFKLRNMDAGNLKNYSVWILWNSWQMLRFAKSSVVSRLKWIKVTSRWWKIVLATRRAANSGPGPALHCAERGNREWEQIPQSASCIGHYLIRGKWDGEMAPRGNRERTKDFYVVSYDEERRSESPPEVLGHWPTKVCGGGRSERERNCEPGRARETDDQETSLIHW